jgi:hypothetical protein
MTRITKTLRLAAEFLAHRKGLPVLVGVGLVLLNVVVRLLPSGSAVEWLVKTDLLLHIGIIIGLLGVLLGDAL